MLFAFLVAVEVFVVRGVRDPAARAVAVAGAAGAGRSCCCSPTSGIAVVGTLVGALAVQTRARDLLVPLLALPLSVPLVIAGRARRAPLLAEGGAGALEARWLADPRPL